MEEWKNEGEREREREIKRRRKREREREREDEAHLPAESGATFGGGRRRGSRGPSAGKAPSSPAAATSRSWLSALTGPPTLQRCQLETKQKTNSARQLMLYNSYNSNNLMI